MVRRRATVSLIAVLAVAGMLTMGCQSGGETPVASGGDRGERGAAEQKPPPEAEFTVAPGDGATKVRPDEPVTVSVENGTLTDVEVTDSDGEPVRGELDEEKTTWVSSVGLVGDTKYRVRASAENSEGTSAKTDQSFRTLTPSGILGTDIYPLAGETVGIGHPIVVNFSHPATTKAAKADLEERLEIETSKKVKGSWHWFDDQEVHYRPKEYWPAHTDVTLRINTKGATNGNGAWGIKNKVKEFEIGRSVLTKVDLFKHQAKVFVDGKLARKIPVTGGQSGWETRSGTKVVLGKELDKTFTDEQIDAEEDYELLSPYALRITWSGEFLHTAEWSTWAHGYQNVSHGCVGMNYDNSQWLWNISQIGDPVETKSSGPAMDVIGNGYGDWNMSWKEWKAGSAL